MEDQLWNDYYSKKKKGMEDKLLTLFDCLVLLCGFAALCVFLIFLCHNPELIGMQDAWNKPTGVAEQMGFDYSEDL